ncbi:sensor histidine kinase [Nocardioides sp. URHA0020]|uniref:sensor histidine kinase n=1 Tax=Nocardioides sp. URHA0020 TaxID=1380392 RepID=UPI00048BA95D|nr:HAMP domain-containing sensor histidine kinase [Nocardioides sp. URHA0020]
MTRLRDRFRSLTARLVLTTVALILVATTLIGVATTAAMRNYLTDQLDHQVQDNLSRMLRGPRGPGLGNEVGTVTGVFPTGDTASSSVVEDDESGRPKAQALPEKATAALDRVPADGDVHSVDIPGLGSYRVVAADLSDGTLAVGLPTGDIDDALSTLWWLEVLFGLVAVLAGGGAALVVVRRQLRPLREVAATAHAVSELPLAEGEIDLAERVPDHLTDERTEVGQVGSALNTLLEHVETSLAARHRSEQQVRQFVADASHELRTPLATIAGYTELARQRPDDPGMLGTALDKVEEESDRMTSLVEDLLLLARLDAGRPLEREPVDLTRLLVEAVSDARVIDADHRWRVELPDDLVDSPALVTGDELRLHQVVTNLLTNARKYTPAGTTVTVTVRRTGFSVHDDGPGFPPDLVEHAFERFARGDAARTRGQEVGVGLGLALVDAIVSAHHGRVTLRSAPGDTTVDVSLPG